jgi:hypothetical protein
MREEALARLDEAAQAHEVATRAYLLARSDYETAVQTHDPGDRRRQAAATHMNETAGEYSRTLLDLVAERRAAVPSFEVLLMDPTMQVDPESVVLASILAYSQAKPATAGLPVRTDQKRCR